MKTAFAEKNIEIVGITPDANAECEISLGPEMFDLLSGIYKDIILACVREPMTNALDGMARLLKHNPVAKILPVEIHLPTRLEPYFAVKDYGSSMTHHEVVTIFKSYGKSTKRDTNDEVGGFGIGSKAPYAYEGADQWTMECRLDGEKRIYSAYRNDRGIPSLTLVHTIDTIEPNGVTVTIPVAVEDFYTFKSKVAQLLPFFPMAVKITGDTLNWSKPEYVLSGTGWGVMRGSHNNKVIMGNVPYTVDHRWLAEHGDLPLDLFHGHSLHLTVPIGQVLMAPNREMLKDCKHTFDGIEQASKLFRKEFRDKVEAQIQAATTKWQALTLLHDSYGVAALRKDLSGIKWRGETLDVTIGLEFRMEELTKDVPDLTLEICENAGRSGTFTIHPKSYGRILPGDRFTRVVYDDMDDTAASRKRLRYFMAMLCGAPGHLNGGTRNGKRRSRWESDSANEYGIAYLFSSKNVTPDELAELLSGVTVEVTSLMSDPPKPVKTVSTRTKTKVKRLIKGTSYRKPQTWWEPVDVIVEDGGLYVGLEGQNLLGYQGDADDLYRMVQHAKQAGLLDPTTEVYGIPRTLKSIETKPGWQRVTAHIREEAAAVVKVHAKELIEYSGWMGVITDDLVLALIAMDLTSLPVRHPVRKLAEGAAQWRTRMDELCRVRALADNLNIPLPQPKRPPFDASALLQSVRDKYPMLVALDATFYSQKLTEFMTTFQKEMLRYIKSA